MDLTRFPRTVFDFEARFSSEEACRDFLREAKWPEGFVCDRCGNRRSYYVAERGLEQCTACKRQISVTARTLFHGARAGLRKWFRAIFEFMSRKHRCNAQDIVRIVGISEPVAWQWLHKFREALGRRPKTPLDGTVEVDESYVGGPEEGARGRARGERKILVAGAVECNGEGCGRVRLQPAESAGAEHLQYFVSQHVAENAKVKSDGWKGYKGLDAVYEHEVEVIGDPRTACRKFPRIHRVFSLFKRLLLGTYHGSWSKRFASAYCGEFEYRFNRRTSALRSRLFAHVVLAGVHESPSIFRKSRSNHEKTGVS